MSPDAAHNEVVKNSMFPATGLMYLVGTHLIHRTRREVADQSGPDFDLRSFHDRFLSFGSIPVSLSRQAILGQNQQTRQPTT